MIAVPQIAFAKPCSRYGQLGRTCSLHGHCREADRVEAGEALALTGCADFVQFHQLTVSAQGIGDVMQGLAIAAGWKRRNPDKRLHLVVPHLQWAELFEGYDSLGTAPLPGTTDVLPQLSSRGGLHFVEAASRVPPGEKALPALRPLPPDAAAWAEQYRGSIILAPISLGSGISRDWALGHWQSLERHLGERGGGCVIVGAGTDAGRLRGFAGPVLAGQPASRVAALMRAASAVVSNESGMGHLAGALGVPCVVLAAQLIAAPIYAVWPSVRVLQGPLPCGGCRWAGPNFRPACNVSCDNLQAISPESVLAGLAMLDAPLDAPQAEPPLVADAALNAAIEGHLAQLVVPAISAPLALADRRQTMRAFLRHLAGLSRPIVVETGCQRAASDYGAGMSSTIFGLLLKGKGGRLVSLDNDAGHAAFCRDAVRGLPVEVVQTDSRDWLRACATPIDALYLDSADIETERYQECCLEEARLALPHLALDAPILIDDTVRTPDGWWGKGKLAVPWLLANGWRVLATQYQTLLGRT